MERLPLAIARFKTKTPVLEGGSELRGFIANMKRDNPLFHHHLEGGLIYSYPLVQYKVLDGIAMIWGIAEGAELVKSLVDGVDHLLLGKHIYEILDVEIIEEQTVICETEQMIRYRFCTPWLALNQENYLEYKLSQGWLERKRLLNGILVGNILSMCKGLNTVVRRNLRARTRLDQVNVTYKGIPHIGFIGEFQVNIMLPAHAGLGKGASRGFGTISNIEA